MSDATANAHHAAERVARESYGRLLAFLAARTRDVAGAEEALADAFAAALSTWPVRGVPDNPDGWILTAARHRQTDFSRRRQTQTAGEQHLLHMADEIEDAARESTAIPDRRLALMFACAHPAIDPHVRTPLILQTILGLSAEAIATAFLLPPKTIGQRLVRAKARIREAGIPFSVPEVDELPKRLDAVLEAIYAAYARGWSEIGDGVSPLAGEAMWLGRLVVSMLPEEPEAAGMLALMLYAEARRSARRSSDGSYVPLDLQDVDRWNHDQLREAEGLLRRASGAGPTGRYQLEAAIQSAHTARRVTGLDTRAAVVALYDHLVALTGSPVAMLNRAGARAALHGPAVALESLAPLASDARMRAYQPYWALRGHLLAEVGRSDEAREALTVALGLANDQAVRRYLEGRLRDIGPAQ